jgi:hypothetical protein
MKTTGVVTTKVSDTLCAGAPKDVCACTCYHEVQWTCEGDAVVCKARFGSGKLETVGDKVCEMRGAPKPASTAELRVSSECKPFTQMRGSAPTAGCLAQWGATAKTAEEAEEVSEVTEEADQENLPLLDESFASALALAALFTLSA